VSRPTICTRTAATVTIILETGGDRKSVTTEKNPLNMHTNKTIQGDSRWDKTEVGARTAASARGWVVQSGFDQSAILAIEITVS
jgi:hypothetical protein